VRESKAAADINEANALIKAGIHQTRRPFAFLKGLKYQEPNKT
jgi:hypothetical protein